MCSVLSLSCFYSSFYHHIRNVNGCLKGQSLRLFGPFFSLLDTQSIIRFYRCTRAYFAPSLGKDCVFASEVSHPHGSSIPYIVCVYVCICVYIYIYIYILIEKYFLFKVVAKIEFVC